MAQAPHPQPSPPIEYLLVGKAGGQTVIGGANAGDDLTLQSTSHATRGSIFALDQVIIGSAMGAPTAGLGTMLRVGSSSVSTPLSPNIVSTANAVADIVSFTSSDPKVTGSTNITNPAGFNFVNVGRFYPKADSPLTITYAAALAIQGPPEPGDGGPIVITNPYSIWVQSGVTRLDGHVGVGVTSPNLSVVDRAVTIGAGTSGDKVAALELQGSRTVNGSFGRVIGYHQGNQVAMMKFTRDGSVDSSAISFDTSFGGAALETRLSLFANGRSQFFSKVFVGNNGNAPGMENGTVLRVSDNVGDTLSFSSPIASAVGAVYNFVDISATTPVISGSTNISSSDGFNTVSIGRAFPKSASAVNISYAASLSIEGEPEPSGAGLTTITNPYAIWVKRGKSLFNGRVQVGGSSGAYITSTAVEKAAFSEGWERVGSDWIARTANVAMNEISSGDFHWYSNNGIAPDSVQVPYQIASLHKNSVFKLVTNGISGAGDFSGGSAPNGYQMQGAAGGTIAFGITPASAVAGTSIARFMAFQGTTNVGGLFFTSGGATDSGYAHLEVKGAGASRLTMMAVTETGVNIGSGTSPNLGASGKALTVTAGTTGDNIGRVEIQGSRTIDSSFAVLDFYHKGNRVSRMTGFRAGADDSGELSFATANAGVAVTSMHLDKAGRLLVGPTQAASFPYPDGIQIQGQVAQTAHLCMGRVVAANDAYSTANIGFYNGTTTESRIAHFEVYPDGALDAGKIILSTKKASVNGLNNVMTVTSLGAVGIGTSVPATIDSGATLVVSGTNGIYVTANATTSGGAAGFVWKNDLQRFQVYLNGTGLSYYTPSVGNYVTHVSSGVIAIGAQTADITGGTYNTVGSVHVQATAGASVAMGRATASAVSGTALATIAGYNGATEVSRIFTKSGGATDSGLIEVFTRPTAGSLTLAMQIDTAQRVLLGPSGHSPAGSDYLHISHASATASASIRSSLTTGYAGMEFTNDGGKKLQIYSFGSAFGGSIFGISRNDLMAIRTPGSSTALAIGTDSGGGNVYFGAGNALAQTIDTSGRVLFGIFSPADATEIVGAARAGTCQIVSKTTSTTAYAALSVKNDSGALGQLYATGTAYAGGEGADVVAFSANKAFVLYSTSTVRIQTASGSANVAVFGGDSFGGGSKVIFIGNATTAPTTNPTGGGVLYAEGGALKWRGSGGTVTVVGPA